MSFSRVLYAVSRAPILSAISARADGPSQQAYAAWKKSGLPTASILQSSTFGLATRKSDNAGDAIGGKASAAPSPLPTVARVNPITWTGGPQGEREPLRGWDSGRRYDGNQFQPLERSLPQETPMPFAAPTEAPPAPLAMRAPEPPAMPPPAPLPFNPDQMQQTWSQLMRTGKVRPSAAQSMIEMPPDMSYEQPAPAYARSQALMTIGLHPRTQPVKRSSAFTSDFRDPFGGAFA